MVDNKEDIIVKKEDADKVTNVAGPSSSAAPISTPAYTIASSSFLTLFKPKKVIKISNTNNNIIIISICKALLNLYIPKDKLKLCPLNYKEICKMLIKILYNSIIRADIIIFQQYFAFIKIIYNKNNKGIITTLTNLIIYLYYKQYIKDNNNLSCY